MREPTISQLFGVLARQTGTLLRQEVRLATVELTDKARMARGPISQLMLGGLVILVGSAVLLVALVLGLGVVLPLWAAALLVGSLLLLGGALTVRRAQRRVRELDPIPTETLMSFEETGTWVAKQLH